MDAFPSGSRLAQVLDCSVALKGHWAYSARTQWGATQCCDGGTPLSSTSERACSRAQPCPTGRWRPAPPSAADGKCVPRQRRKQTIRKSPKARTPLAREWGWGQRGADATILKMCFKMSHRALSANAPTRKKGELCICCQKLSLHTFAQESTESEAELRGSR